MTWVTYIQPLHFGYLINWNQIGIMVMWQFSEYIDAALTLMVYTGFAFEIPSLIAGIAWLRIVTRELLAQCRPYAILAAFVIAAWVTPTPDPLNQAIVAIPICLLYELGLLLARRVPAESAHPTV